MAAQWDLECTAVFAIDEGILQVARYKNPDPLAYFFQKRMLQVETTQILDLMLPEFQRFLALTFGFIFLCKSFSFFVEP